MAMFRSLSHARREPPAPTDCELCRKTETGPLRTRMAGLYDAFLRDGPMRPSEYLIVAGMAPVIMASLGSSGPTWYERHRQRWIDTGDLAELERMLRHDLPPQAVPAPPKRRRSRMLLWPPAITVPLGAVSAAAMLAAAIWLVGLTGWLW